MPNTSTRLLLGFAAGALSHVIFQGGLSVAYYAANLTPGVLWTLKPIPPFGVPGTLNYAFWAGLWGVAYGLLEPQLTARLGRLQGGLVFGVAALLVFWFVVPPLKGTAIAGGFDPAMMLIYTGFHLIFGVGLAVFYGSGLALIRRDTGVSPKPLHG